MNPLAFNMEFSKQVHSKFNFALAILPVGFMFGSFGPLWIIATYLSGVLGIPHDAPVKEHPNGLLWFVIFLVVMLVLMLGGYLLGWILNAIVIRVVFGWPMDKIRRVFLYSELPASWLKDDIYDKRGAKSSGQPISGWAKTRQKGKLHFVVFRGVLAWGVPMYLLMACRPVVIGKVIPTALYFISQAVMWGAAGAVFGLIIWHLSERQFIKKNSNNAG